MGKASFALQHPIALEIQGWDCVSPREACMPWGQQSPEQGRGRLPPRIWLYAAAWWPQVVLLHLGSREGHQEQPCVSDCSCGFVLTQIPVPG